MLSFKLWLENTIPSTIRAYRCGGLPGSKTPGEGTQILGPGSYYASRKDIAERYCKYFSNPYWYVVDIETKDLYDPINGTPGLSEKFALIAQELGYKNTRDMPWGSTLSHGQGNIGSIVRILGNSKALEMFKKHGIKGAYEKLNTDSYEIAVYDTSIVIPISQTQMKP